jgi:hypothetical protein
MNFIFSQNKNKGAKILDFKILLKFKFSQNGRRKISFKPFYFYELVI